MLIEQAVFTSARTVHAQGYQLVARSPGVTEEDAREITAWGPSHGALCAERDEASSVNFHRLASGTFCVSKTVAAGDEYSGRGGARIYTQFLLVPPAVLARFSNNPFALLRAAWAKGLLTTFTDVPTTLEPFSLVGRSAPVDEGLLAQLADQWGPQRVARLVTAALTPGIQLLAGAGQCETLLGGLINCLPVECRTELSFTTGLCFSPCRPFRLGPLDDDAAQQRRAIRQEGVSVVDLSSGGLRQQEPSGWAAYVAEAIAADQLPRLAEELRQPRCGLNVDGLDALGEKLRRELLPVPLAAKIAADSREARSTTRPLTGNERLFRTDVPREQRREPERGLRDKTGSIRPPVHRETVSSPAAGVAAEQHAVDDPAIVEWLEQLDDAVYDAIHGKLAAVDSMRDVWAQLSARLNRETLTAMREQYLRYTLTLWEAGLDEGLREPQRAIRSLDVLAVLLEPE